jgi:RNA polymerase sigma-70 factor (ECF subfamily)
MDFMDDVKILQESINRPAAFALIVDRYQSAFLKKAGYILRNEDEAEDAVQDTFVKIYANANRFAAQEGASFSSWAYKILLNTCYSRYKKLKREGEFVTKMDQDLIALTPSKDEAYFEDKLSWIMLFLWLLLCRND